MPNTRSAQKAQRQAERRAARNRPIRSAVRTYVKKAAAALAAADERATEAVREAVRALDKAAKKGIVHKNSAARRKSRLMSRLHALSVGAEQTPTPPATRAAGGRRGAAGTPKAPGGKSEPSAGRGRGRKG